MRFCRNIKRSKTGIPPEDARSYFNNLQKSIDVVDPDGILSRLPSSSQVPENDAGAETDFVTNILKSLRYENLYKLIQKRNNIRVLLGHSVAETDFNEIESSDSSDTGNISVHSASREDEQKNIQNMM
ncbi:hypothetical protein JTB14_017198 [Gonioctena quinquepunctata]|nr:hypothetical protein JTB14_017198 [Gonioctena quinquepunctata]